MSKGLIVKLNLDEDLNVVVLGTNTSWGK